MSTRRQTLLALLVLVSVLLLMAGGWWRYANETPVYSRPVAALPSANAYDDYVAAAGLLSADAPLPGRKDRTPQSARPRILAANGPALQRLRRGFSHRYFNPPLASATQPLPELASFRRLAGLLVQEGKSAETHGRLREAAGSYLDCLRLGSDAPLGGAMAHATTGVAIHELALPPLYALVDRLDARSAGDALERMRKLDAHALTFSQVLTGQRDEYLALVPALLKSPTAEQLGRSIGYGPDLRMSATYLLTPKRKVVEDLRRYMDASIQRSRAPFVSAGPQPQVPDDPLNQWLAPASDHAWCCWLERDAAWRVLEARLAIRIYQAGHGGRSPSSLSQLAPTVLPTVPVDPFVEQPLIYHPHSPEPRVYSRGPDGDDDGGRTLNWPRRGSDVATMRALR